MFSPNLTSWESQYELLKRDYAKLLNPHTSSVDHEDDFRHFFQDCWHLKDWIKNDQNIPPSIRDNVEKKVNKSKALVIAGDLATGCKHLKRDPKPGRRKTTEGAEIISKSVTVPIVGGPADVHYIIKLGDGSTLSAQDAATDAYSEWDALLRTLTLIK